MKRTIATAACILAAYISSAQTLSSAVQASPSNLNAPATAQPVPNSLSTEKSAPTAKPLITTPQPEKPPIYPGAEVRAVETQRQLIFPAAPPAPTQPVQVEPLVPVESTNTLSPTQPPRDKASKKNKPVTQP